MIFLKIERHFFNIMFTAVRHFHDHIERRVRRLFERKKKICLLNKGRSSGVKTWNAWHLETEENEFSARVRRNEQCPKKWRL